jgi:hypothetical protein
MEICLIVSIFLAFLILFLLQRRNVEEGFKSFAKPDDSFTDGLDHKYGINKQHRHHSF